MPDTDIKSRLKKMIKIVGNNNNLNENQISTIIACAETVLEGGADDTNSYLLRVFEQIGSEE